MKKVIFSGLIFLFFAFQILSAQPEFYHSGCHHLQAIGPTHEPTINELILMENSNRRSDSIDILNYTITLDISDVAGKKIDGFTEVNFRTRMEGINSITLDLRKLNISKVLYKDEEISHIYNDSILIIPFKENLPINSTSKVVVYYNGVPSKDPVWGGFYFEGGYVYNLGIGLSSTPPNFGKVWFPCFDNFVERSTYDYIITTKSDMKAYCVGSFISEEVLPSGKIKRHYSMLDQIPTYLSNIAASDYVSSKFIHAGRYGNIPVEYLSKPANITQMNSQFSNMPSAIDALEFWFGPYRFERVGYVATTVGAMEHPTNTAFPISSITQDIQANVERTMAHELGHHWWGDLTTLDDARDMWIKEGTAEYSSHLFHEYTYGKSHFIKTVKNNLSDIMKNAHRNDGNFLPLSPMPYSNTYGTHTYKKGAAMIHNMRAYLGDSAFRKTCMMVFDSLSGKSMNAYEFRDFLNKYSGVDMTNYFEDFIFNPGYIGIYIDSFYVKNNNELLVQIQQKGYFTNHIGNGIPVFISVYDENWQRLDFKTEISGAVSISSFQIPTGFKPKIVLVNENQNMNLAALQGSIVVNKIGTFSISSVDFLALNCSAITDSVFLNIVHNYVGPSGTENKASNIDRISDTHFWQVSTLGNSNATFTGTIDYNGVDKFNLDYKLIPAREDSIMLVYRPDSKSPWIQHPSYSKLGTSATDKKGFMRIQNLIPGEYAFAFGVVNTVAVEDENNKPVIILPNPNNGKFSLNIEDNGSAYDVKVFSLNGHQIYEDKNIITNTEIDISSCSTGFYEVVLEDVHSNKIHCFMIEKVD